jgi:catechol 2,3-dioxygenase-like lactoylglutathione lyase family enzyme
MKRFHVHVSVKNLDESMRFYSAMFGAAPTVQKPDYAKWMLEDPRLNFAISQRTLKHGINHLGFQTDSAEELAAVHAQLQQADTSIVSEEGANCCYAKSDKHWVQDPSGIAWESFHSLDNIPVYGEQHHEQTETAAPSARIVTSEPAQCGSSCSPTSFVANKVKAAVTNCCGG